MPLSTLQHYLYCPRQCALIHLERAWEENIFTAQGRVLHDRTDTPQTTVENGIKVARALRVGSRQLGVFGVCDVVEFRADNPVPVEYKRGKPKSHRADEVQLCAQAVCLEEMFETEIVEGLLFYGKTRRRVTVALDATLRSLTFEVAEACRLLLHSSQTPTAVYNHKRCSACSLKEICLPRRGKEVKDVQRMLAAALSDDLPGECS